MKILARASSLKGFVEAITTQGKIELAGLEIQVDPGEGVNVGDFVDLEATLGPDKIWTGRINAHFPAQYKSDRLSPQAHNAQGDSTAVAAGGQSSTPSAASGSGSASAGPVSTPGTATATPSGQRSSVTSSARSQAPTSNPAPVSARRRFGAGTGGQRGESGPSASGGGAASPGRPRFTPSSADKQVSY